MNQNNKNQKATLLKSATFSIAVVIAAVIIFLNIIFIIGMFFVIVSPDYEVYSRVTFVFMGLISAFNVIVLALLIILRKNYDKRVLKRIVLPLREIEHHISNFVHGDYDEPIEHNEENEVGDLFKATENVRLQLNEYRALEQQTKALRQIHISGLMHDIATPVTRINGCATMINEGMVTDSGDIKRFASIILQSTEDINIMLKNLAAIEKYNETDIQLNMQTIDMAEILERFIADLSLDMRPKNIDVRFKNNCVSNAVCQIDVKSCKRALMNLINNSVKYKKPYEDCKIIIALDDYKDESILFSLSDNGVGVEPGSENMIFEMFYRGDSARRNVSDGNGLGLYITKQILMANGAKIWAKNNGDGLTVYVQFQRTDHAPIKWYK